MVNVWVNVKSYFSLKFLTIHTAAIYGTCGINNVGHNKWISMNLRFLHFTGNGTILTLN